jgi:hypothetical protein
MIGCIIIKYGSFVCAVCRDVEEAKVVVREHFLSDHQEAKPEKFEFFEVVAEGDSDSYIHDYPVKSLGFLLDEDALHPGNVIVKYDMEVCATYESLEKAKAGILKHHFVEKDRSEAQYFEFFEVVGKADYSEKSLGNRPRSINGYEVKELGFILA